MRPVRRTFRFPVRLPGLAFLEHLHPPEVRLAALGFGATWYAGMAAGLLFVVLTVTGVLLMYVYDPTVDGAWASVVTLEEGIRHGRLLRILHNLGGQLMLLAVVAHLVRLALRGAWTRSRALNWWIGLGLGLLTVALSYTGYLLPYDQLAYWAVTVGARMAGSAPGVGDGVRRLLLGGGEVGGATLLRFYVHHCVTLPLLLGILLSVHLFRIRRDRGLHLPDGPPDGPRVRSRAGLVRWEMWSLALVTLGAGVLAYAVRLPLGPPADPGVTPDPMKAAWYLVGLQELLHFHPPFFVSWILPLGLLAALGAAPFLPDRWRDTPLGALPPRALGCLVAGFLAVAAASVPPVAWHWNGTVLVACGVAWGVLAWARRPGTRLARVGVGVFLLVWVLGTYGGLTAVALWLRGPGWGWRW